MAKKNRKKLVTWFVIIILIILFTNTSTNFNSELKSKVLFLGLGIMFGSLLNYFKKEDEQE